MYKISEQDFLAIIESLKDVLHLMDSIYQEMIRNGCQKRESLSKNR